LGKDNSEGHHLPGPWSLLDYLSAPIITATDL
ncbi:uncharacterized protein METZ01_LOCUS158935, partial [marine metagenome]